MSVEALPKELDSKYVILEKMGEGGMGAVYKVRHRFFDEIQVLKFMQAKFQESEELRSRFLQEARTAKKVRHRNIAEVIDYSVTSDGTAFIVMEFVDGVNLREVLKRTGGPIDHALVVEIAIQTLAALAELHRHGFVHRDVAPDNLLLSRDNQGQPLIKVIDLGIAKAIENSTQDLTKTGRFMGKMQYASPEQFGGIDGHARVDQRSDLYSFSCVLYELLTGLRLVTSSDYRAVIAAHLYRPPRPFEETDPNNRVPKALRDVVMKGLEKDPNDRYQTADEFAGALKRASGQAATTTAERQYDVNKTEDDAWRTAEQQNSVRGWELFLESYPDSSRARDAQGKLEELERQEEKDWEKASAADDAESWHDYLKAHGESPRASRARRRLDRLTEAGEQAAYEAATADKSIESFEKFLSSYPRSRRASEIREELDRLREEAAEENEFSNAANVDTTGAWRTFLKKHSRSGKADDARKRLEAARKREDEEADWQRAQNARTREAWQQFLQIHPDSKYAQDARNQLSSATAEELESADWDSAMRVNSSAAWNTFIERHPKSKQAAQAWTNFAAAKEREDSARKEVVAKHERDSDDRAFEEAIEIDSADTWELFIEQHKESRHIPEAKERLKKATEEREADTAWKRTIEVNTAEAYETFAKKFTASRHTAEAENRAKQARTKADTAQQAQQQREQRDWANAESLATPDAWREYMRIHPTSPRTNTAQKNLEAAMRRVREEADWAAAIGRGDLESVERFLKEHPESHRTQAARDRIEKLKAQVAKTTVGELEKVQPTGPKPPAPPKKAKEKEKEKEVIPSTTVEQLPVTRFETPAVQAPAKGSPMKWVIAAVAALAIIAGGYIAFRPKAPEPGAGGPTQPPPAAIGNLMINALPWGEVKSIKDTQGIDRLKKKPVYTPFVIPLPPGTYTVELTNPNSGKTVTRTAIVNNGATAQLSVELDTIDADEYLKGVTKR